MDVIKTERGWPGHHICADDCQFRRNTLLTREDKRVRIVVSTVGAMVDKNEHVYSTVGCDRVYETMVFHAKFEDPYWDADVSKQIYDFNSSWDIKPLVKGGVVGKGLVSFEMDAQANDMHEAVVAEIASRMYAGDMFEEKDEEDD